MARKRYTVEQIIAKLQQGLMDDGAAELLVDFTKVDFVSSAGFRVLLATAKRLGSIGGSLRSCGLEETVNEVFERSSRPGTTPRRGF